MFEGIVGKHKFEIETPALLLDIECAERNISRMAEFFSDKECKLRPHIKTHKLPMLAQKQIEAGAIGITCATLIEAEVFVQSGIKNILIANEIIGLDKIKRMVNLSRYCELIVCVDNITNAREISKVAEMAGLKVGVLVEINVGLNRCGVAPGVPALELVNHVSKLKGLSFKGLMGYEGGMFIKDTAEKERKCRQSNALLIQTRELIEKEGFPVEITTGGGSNTHKITGLCPGITDIQPGSYATMDIHDRIFGLDFEQAITVLTTVISRPEKGRAVIDAGKKAISLDEGLPEFVAGGITLEALNEEHGKALIHESENNLKVGDKLELIPSHGCTTIPLYENYYIIRKGFVESVYRIHPRRS